MVFINRVLFKPLFKLFSGPCHLVVRFFLTIPDLTPVGVMTLAICFMSILIGLETKNTTLIQTCILLYLILFGAFIFTYVNLKNIKIIREMPKQVFAKQLFQIEVTLSNEKKKLDSYWVNLHDDFYRKENQASINCFCIQAEGVVTKVFSTSIHRRGVYEKFTYRLTSTFPLGFFLKEIQKIEYSNLTVYPQPMSAIEINNLISSQSGEGDKAILSSNDYIGDFKGVREFQPGDPLKNIHWKASNRVQKLLVKETEITSAENTVIIAHSYYPNLKIRSRRTFEKMVQFLCGAFLHLVNEQSSFKFAGSFDNYREHEVISDGEELQDLLSVLASAKEVRERNMDPLHKAVEKLNKNCRLIVVSNMPGEFWVDDIKKIAPEAICLDLFARFSRRRS